MAQLLFSVTYTAANIERSVYYDNAGGRSVTTSDSPIDGSQPTEPELIGVPDGGYPYPDQSQIGSTQCENGTAVRFFAVHSPSLARFETEADAAYCALPSASCDLDGTAAWDQATETVTVTVTTTHGPATVALVETGPYFDTVDGVVELNTSELPSGTRPLYLMDAGIDGTPCRKTIAFAIVRGTTGGPDGAFDSFVSQGVTVYLAYENTTQDGRRIVVSQSQPDPTILEATSQDRGRAAGEEITRFCEGSTLVRLLASLQAPFATIVAAQVPGPCGVSTTDPDPDPDPEPEPDGPLMSVVQLPQDWAPVHLPVLLTVLTVPALSGKPREVVCLVEGSQDGITWSTAGRFRPRTPDAANQVRFNFSEFLKHQFTISPPVSGLDPSLSLRWRARLGFAPTFTSTEGEQLRTAPLHVVNGAAPNAGLGTYLSDLIPLPSGYPYLLSKISSAGVSNLSTLPGSTPAECPPYPLRLVWLNQKGGWNSFVFAGKHERGTDVPGGAIWTDQQGAERNSDLGPVRPVVKVYSDRLTPELAEMVRTVRSSVQVYAMPSDNQYIAVRVVPGSFPDYKEGDKITTVDFSLRYPKTLVQTQ